MNTMKLVFGNEKHPTLIYTNLATGEQSPGKGGQGVSEGRRRDPLRRRAEDRKQRQHPS